MATSYTLRFSDPTNTSTIVVLGTTVGPGKNNYSTSLDLTGPGYANYGQDTAQNFLKLLENFAGPNPPENSIKGQLWYDTSNPLRYVLRVNNGSITSNRWPSATGIYQQSVDPTLTYTSGIKVGDMWVDTQNNQVKLRSSTNEWIIVGPNIETGASKSGSEVRLLESNTGTNYPVILNWANGKVVEIISYNSFTPKSVIDGFNSVRAGTNLTSRVPARYNGIAESASSLYISPGVTIPATGVLKNRSTTIPQIHTGTFVVESITGFQVTNPSSREGVKVYSTSSEAFVTYTNYEDSSMLVGIGTGTDAVSFLRFKSNGNIGVNNLVPTATLDVGGSGKFSDEVEITSTTESIDIGTGALVVAGGASFGQTVNANTLTIESIATIKGGIVLGVPSGSDVIIEPAENDSYDLGSIDNGFRHLYVSRIGSPSGHIDIYGSVSTATQLLNAQEITVEGHLTTVSPAIFDGTAPVTIEVEANTSLITATTTATVGTPTQNLLIWDEDDPAELKHITKTNFLSDVYSLLFQPGMIIPYTTSTLSGTLSDNFFLCDGSEKYTADEPALWSVIGDRYGSTLPTVTFNIPDMMSITTATGGYPIYYIIKR